MYLEGRVSRGTEVVARSLKHLEESKEEHTRTVNQQDKVLVWEGKEHEGRKYRNLSIS